MHSAAWSASPENSSDGSSPQTSSSPACSVASFSVCGLRLRASRWSAMRRDRIVCIHALNSPTDLPSNADAIALNIASEATSSTSEGGSFRRARFTSTSQYP